MSETLIRSTELEELLMSYQMMAQRHPGSALNIKLRNEIACQVVYAFEFLSELGKPYSEMSYNEFELAQREIKKRAKNVIDRLQKELSEKGWFLFFNFLRSDDIEIGINRNKFLWENGYPKYYKSYDVYICTFNYDGCLAASIDQNLKKKVPPNFIELVEEIFQKRHNQEDILSDQFSV